MKKVLDAVFVSVYFGLDVSSFSDCIWYLFFLDFLGFVSGFEWPNRVPKFLFVAGIVMLYKGIDGIYAEIVV